MLLQVTDLGRAAAFYGEVLGLARVPDESFPEPQPHACFEAGQGGHVVLIQVDAAETPISPECVYFSMSPDEWRALEAALTANGCPALVDRQGGMRGTGELRTRIADPDGNVLDLHAFEPSFYDVPAAGQGKIVAGPIEQFPVGSVTRIPSGRFFLVHLEGGFLAISEVCTHRQFTITYQPEHFRFYCPLHRYRYTRTGHVISRAAPLNVPPLHKYEIEYLGGHVIVDTDVSVPRSEEEVDCVLAVPQRV
jgi:nitrite reductase/ring-hydroxylating ferredoxin subunit/predicted enzyme related to lactoylglutathione lyase